MIRPAIFVTLLVALMIVGCSTAKMPAVTDVPTQVSLPGKVVWHDLISDTPEASKRFYQELFGWEFEEVGMRLGIFNSIDYTLIRHNGRLMGGMVNQAQLPAREDISQWVTLISVADVDAASAAVQAAGGSVLTAAVDLAERGRLALVTDPEGAIFSLLQTNSQDPPDDIEADVGGFLWDELWAEDIDAAAAFYKRVVAYAEADGIEPADAAMPGRYRVLRSQGRPRAGILQMPVEDLNPIWVNYLRIADAAALDAIVARVEGLGGTILLDPQDREIGGRVALIAGPSGAGIALQTWPPETRQQGE